MKSTNTLLGTAVIVLLSACAASVGGSVDTGVGVDVRMFATDASPNRLDSGDTQTEAAIEPQDTAPLTDTGPLHVLACGSISTDQWESITPVDETSSCSSDADCAANCAHCIRNHCDYGYSEAVAVHPHDAGTYYVQIHACGNGYHRPTDGLYRSTDCGATWAKIGTGRNEDQSSTGSWVALLIDPIHPDVMYTAATFGNSGVWKSTNGGVDWDQTLPATSEAAQHIIANGWFDTLSMDPTDPLHIVASPHFSCDADTLQEHGCLTETRDGGATWRTFNAPHNNEGGGAIVINHDVMVFPHADGGMQVTSDDGATWQPAGAEGNGFTVVQVPNGTYYMSSRNGTLMSSDGLRWSVAPGSHGSNWALTISDTHVYEGGYFRNEYRSASFDNVTTWNELTVDGIPSQDLGPAYLSFDVGHHVLISSNFGGGLWRRGMP